MLAVQSFRSIGFEDAKSVVFMGMKHAAEKIRVNQNDVVLLAGMASFRFPWKIFL